MLELPLNLLVYADEAVHLALNRPVLLRQNSRVSVQSHLLFLQGFLLFFKSLGGNRSSFVLVLDLSSFPLSPLLFLLQLQEAGLKLPSFGNLQASALLQVVLAQPGLLHSLLRLRELLEQRFRLGCGSLLVESGFLDALVQLSLLRTQLVFLRLKPVAPSPFLL